MAKQFLPLAGWILLTTCLAIFLGSIPWWLIASLWSLGFILFLLSFLEESLQTLWLIAAPAATITLAFLVPLPIPSSIPPVAALLAAILAWSSLYCLLTIVVSFLFLNDNKKDE